MFRDKTVYQGEFPIFCANATKGKCWFKKRNYSHIERSLCDEKRVLSFSPTTFFVSCVTLNVVGTTKNATAFNELNETY